MEYLVFQTLGSFYWKFYNQLYTFRYDTGGSRIMHGTLHY